MRRRNVAPARPASAPLIAITATSEVAGDAFGDALHVRVNDSYVRAIAGAGGLPVVLPPLEPALAERLLDSVAGLVLTGGEDVGPAHYGAVPHPLTQPTNVRRDAWELALARGARARGIPTLAICRGAQILNVALGGGLVQDLPSEWDDALAHDAAEPRDARVHEVRLMAGSRLGEALGTAACRVNSFHHQALGPLAPALRATAHATDGVIEGVEAADGWWMLGVQWHPEELIDTAEPWDRRLFATFVEASRVPRAS